MKTFNKTKYLNDIKKLDNLNLYQYKDVNKVYIIDKQFTLTSKIYLKKYILQEHPEVICDKYPLVSQYIDHQSINNSDQTKLKSKTPYLRTSVGVSSISLPRLQNLKCNSKSY